MGLMSVGSSIKKEKTFAIKQRGTMYNGSLYSYDYDDDGNVISNIFVSYSIGTNTEGVKFHNVKFWYQPTPGWRLYNVGDDLTVVSGLSGAPKVFKNGEMIAEWGQSDSINLVMSRKGE